MMPIDTFRYVKNNQTSRDLDNLTQLYQPIIGNDAQALYLYFQSFFDNGNYDHKVTDILNHLQFGAPRLNEALDFFPCIGNPSQSFFPFAYCAIFFRIISAIEELFYCSYYVGEKTFDVFPCHFESVRLGKCLDAFKNSFKEIKNRKRIAWYLVYKWSDPLYE